MLLKMFFFSYFSFETGQKICFLEDNILTKDKKKQELNYKFKNKEHQAMVLIKR